MRIKNQDFKYLILFNFVFIGILYIDLLIPINHNLTERIKSFYTTVNVTPGWRNKPSKEIKYIAECYSENLYYLGKFPTELENIQNGTKVEMVQTLLFNKTKEIKVEQKTYSVSFLSLTLIVYIFLFCIAVNILNVFYTNKYLDIGLILGTAPIYFIGLAYLSCY